ncbi:MAG: CRISPR system precrRNA processing endoribonuclease RAMP protein Cas6 [Candidatus Diapherotrites archaeon]|nr:CRISPR system precrRNA processing endoribonuclease RAMP protein Cas6 [Candidatus Diapherotrites archaeon]
MEIEQAEFRLCATSKVLLPTWKGSTLRGAVGASLKNLYCLLPERKSCYKCKNGDVCPYGYLYETQPKISAEKFSAYKQVTKPIVFEPPLEDKTLYLPGDIIKFTINFFGKSKKYVGDIENAIKEITSLGRFRNRGFGSVSYSGKEQRKILIGKDYSNYKIIKIEFLTPTQLVFGDSVQADISFSHIIKNLSRKYSAIVYFHENKIEKINWPEVFCEADKAIKIEDKLEHKIIETYSSKSGKNRKMLGFIGLLGFDCSDILDKKLIYYLLDFGKYSHIGKFSSFGNGMYNFSLS